MAGIEQNGSRTSVVVATYQLLQTPLHTAVEPLEAKARRRRQQRGGSECGGDDTEVEANARRRRMRDRRQRGGADNGEEETEAARKEDTGQLIDQ